MNPCSLTVQFHTLHCHYACKIQYTIIHSTLPYISHAYCCIPTKLSSTCCNNGSCVMTTSAFHQQSINYLYSNSKFALEYNMSKKFSTNCVIAMKVKLTAYHVQYQQIAFKYNDQPDYFVNQHI